MAAIVVMGLFPPWVIQSRELNRWGKSGQFKYITEPGPYRWIDSPPPRAYPCSGSYPKVFWWERPRFIDLYRLGVQYFVVAVVTSGLIVILGDKKTRTQ